MLTLLSHFTHILQGLRYVHWRLTLVKRRCNGWELSGWQIPQCATEPHAFRD